MNRTGRRGPGTIAKAAVLLSAGLLIGCADGGGPDCLFTCGESASPPVIFALSPDSAHILLGDSTHFYTWSCDGGACVDLTENGNLYSNWTITGPAVWALMPDGNVTKEMAFATRIVVRGTMIGESIIRAVAAGDTGKHHTVRVIVADSAVIDTVVMSAEWTGSGALRNGGTVTVRARVHGAGNRYNARPSEWSLSDSTVLELGASQFNGGIESRLLYARKAGTAEVRARFLNRETRVTVTVVP
jgi:hypothetical protein